MATSNDRNLICYLSWGRREYVEQTFIPLVENMRPQDRLLVFDQDGFNADFYLKYKDKIDYLFLTKHNYFIGGAWTLFRQIAQWLIEIKEMSGWYPDYINILESDALIQRGDWIDRLLECFDIEGQKISAVTGYLGDRDPNEKIIRVIGDKYIKNGIHGISMICHVEDFLKIYNYPKFTQDAYFTERIRPKGRIACRFIIKHIGDQRRKAGFFL